MSTIQPAQRGEAEIVRADPDAAVARIVEFLEARRLV